MTCPSKPPRLPPAGKPENPVNFSSSPAHSPHHKNTKSPNPVKMSVSLPPTISAAPQHDFSLHSLSLLLVVLDTSAIPLVSMSAITLHSLFRDPFPKALADGGVICNRGARSSRNVREESALDTSQSLLPWHVQRVHPERRVRRLRHGTVSKQTETAHDVSCEAGGATRGATNWSESSWIPVFTRAISRERNLFKSNRRNTVVGNGAACITLRPGA